MQVRPSRAGTGRAIPALLLFLLMFPLGVQAGHDGKVYKNDFSPTYYVDYNTACNAISPYVTCDGAGCTTHYPVVQEGSEPGHGICTQWGTHDNGYNNGNPFYIGGFNIWPATIASVCPQPTYFAPDGSCQVTPTCPAAGARTLNWSGSGTPPAMIYSTDDNCRYSLASGPILYDSTTGIGLAQYESTGDAAQPGDGSHTPTYDTGNTNCSTSSAGNTLCIDEDAPNCMTFNGSQVCGTTTASSGAKMPADGSCSAISTGAVCAEDALNAPHDFYGNPYPKETQIRGTLPTPTNGTNGNGTSDYEFYSNGAGQTDPASGNTSGQGTAGGSGSTTIEGEVEISGAGVPGWSDGGAGAGGAAGQASIEASIGTSMGVSSSGITPQSAMPVAATCQQLTYYWDGYEFTWPSADGCTKVEQVKTVIGWFFYALTALYLFRLATRKPG